MNEQWRQFIDGYEVSDDGRVRRSIPGRKTFAGRELKAQQMKIGYLAVRPTVAGKNVHFYVHDIVASAFLGPKPEGYSVNHKDGVKTNNSVHNLEYVTHAENMRHAANAGLMVCGEDHPQARMTEESVVALRNDRIDGISFSSLARKYGISIATAFNISTRKLWKHVA